MRVTIDIPDADYRRLKARSVAEGVTVREVVLRAIFHDLESSRPEQRVKFPLIRAKKKRRLNMTNTEVYDLLFE